MPTTNHVHTHIHTQHTHIYIYSILIISNLNLLLWLSSATEKAKCRNVQEKMLLKFEKVEESFRTATGLYNGLKDEWTNGKMKIDSSLYHAYLLTTFKKYTFTLNLKPKNIRNNRLNVTS